VRGLQRPKTHGGGGRERWIPLLPWAMCAQGRRISGLAWDQAFALCPCGSRRSSYRGASEMRCHAAIHALPCSRYQGCVWASHDEPWELHAGPRRTRRPFPGEDNRSGSRWRVAMYCYLHLAEAKASSGRAKLRARLACWLQITPRTPHFLQQRMAMSVERGSVTAAAIWNPRLSKAAE
jgi:hypothetical protein